MKKISVLLMAAAVLVLVTGCASSPAESQTPAAAAAPATSPAATAPAAPDYTKAAVALALGTALPAGESEVLDGFEDGDYWLAVGDTWDQWGAHNLSLSASGTTDKGVTEGSRANEWVFDTIKSGSMATFYTNQPPITDFSGINYITIDVLNPLSVPVRIAMAFQTTDSWIWSSTGSVNAAPGASTLVFNMNKGITSADKKVKTVTGFNDLKTVMFNITDAGGKSGTIYVDNIQIIR